MVKANTFGMMVVSMKGISKEDIGLDKVNGLKSMEIFMKDNFKKITNTVKEFLDIKLERFLKEYLRKV